MAGVKPRGEGLPVSEFTHPVSLSAMALMAVNDHFLKGMQSIPGWFTGKLSDICGMIFFPLFLTALFDTLLYALHLLTGETFYSRVFPPYTLSRRRLLIAVVAVAVGFSVLQVLPQAVHVYSGFHRLVGISVRVTQDPTDLLALPFLGVAYLVGMRRVARGR